MHEVGAERRPAGKPAGQGGRPVQGQRPAGKTRDTGSQTYGTPGRKTRTAGNQTCSTPDRKTRTASRQTGKTGTE